MESLTNGPIGSKLRLTFSYDNRSRRITKQVENWTGSVWSTTVSNRFLYDAWNLVAQLNGTNSSPIETFMWGTDLSGSVQGAGGVGGLLAVSDSSQGTHFAAFDANGNATALVKAADGTSSAKYEYNPFGEDLRTTGPMGKENPLLFSNKVADRETDLRYYGLRYYSPSISAWLARDPISDPEDNLRLAGKQFSVVRDVDLRINSLNLAGEPVIYRYAGNDALNFVDPVGRLKFIGCSPDKQNQLTKDFNGYCAKLKTSLPGCCKNKTILPKLQHICDNSQDYTVQCEAHQLDDCSGNTCGWSRTGNRTIHFCPNGWNTIDCGPLGCTVMHEFTHEIGHPSEKWPRQVEKCLGCP
jgi:RHS repeat-associated protein